MKSVVLVPQYESVSFRVIGPFKSGKDAYDFVEAYFQDEGDFQVVPYNKKLHEKIMEDVSEFQNW